MKVPGNFLFILTVVTVAVSLIYVPAMIELRVPLLAAFSLGLLAGVFAVILALVLSVLFPPSK